MAPLYTRRSPNARNFVRRTIVQLRRPSPQPALTCARVSNRRFKVAFFSAGTALGADRVRMSEIRALHLVEIRDARSFPSHGQPRTHITSNRGSRGPRWSRWSTVSRDPSAGARAHRHRRSIARSLPGPHRGREAESGLRGRPWQAEASVPATVSSGMPRRETAPATTTARARRRHDWNAGAAILNFSVPFIGHCRYRLCVLPGLEASPPLVGALGGRSASLESGPYLA